jgi:putative membrane protein
MQPSYRRQLVQLITVFIAHVIVLYWLTHVLSGFQAASLRSLIMFTIVIAVANAVFWWAFIRLFSWMPAWLYPLLTFVLNGLFIYLLGNQVIGITITTVGTAIWISLWMTAVNAILGGVLGLDEDERFDRTVVKNMIAKRGKPTKTDVPGFLFLEIDGLSEVLFRRALEKGHLPTLKRWIDQGTHQVVGWETDFSAQTGAMQSGILLGNNTDVPAYRWWDREQKRIIMSGLPKDALAIEARLSHGNGLCSDGGSSRGNMFSGDATESMLTFSTIRKSKQGRGPGFYFYLFSPYVVARLITRFITMVIKEWWQAGAQRRRKDKYQTSARNFAYAFMRGGLGPILHDLVTFTVISDVLRGLPAIYALYSAYDDLAHFAGMHTEEAYEELNETDRYFLRIENALKNAPRPYHVVVLSDHGQTIGPQFHKAYGCSLEQLVKDLIKEDISYSDSHKDNWDALNAVLSESANDENTRTAGLMRRMLASRTKEGDIEINPSEASPEKEQEEAQKAKVVVMGSGSTGLIYFTDSPTRMTFEKIQDQYPELIIGLKDNPGIGFILVRSEEQGDIVIGRQGVHYLIDDHVDGKVDPLAVFGPHAADHLRRESSFSNCPDLVVSSVYDPQTQEMPGFENQVSHHGGMGGPQSYPFLLRPTALPYDGIPIIGAENVHHLLRRWREQVQGLPVTIN